MRAVHDREAKPAIMPIAEQILPEIRLAATVRKRLPTAAELFEGCLLFMQEDELSRPLPCVQVKLTAARRQRTFL